MSIIAFLPDELSLRILALVPRSSYRRLRLVCRAWRDAFCPNGLVCAFCPNGPVCATRKSLEVVETWVVFVSKIKCRYMRFFFVDPAGRGCLEIIHPQAYAAALHSTPAPKEMLTPEILELCYRRGFWWKGFNPDTINCLNVQSMEWTEPYSLPKEGHPCIEYEVYENGYSLSATLDGSLFVVVVGDQGLTNVEKVAWLDTTSRTWEALPKLTVKRYFASAVVWHGRICVIGGFDEWGKDVRSREIWDSESRQWTLIPEMWPANVSINNLWSPYVAVVKDRLYLLKRQEQVEESEESDELMYYEDASKSWISMGKFSLSKLVGDESLRVYRMVGIADTIYVFCLAETEKLFSSVALYVKPAISEPLTWGFWRLLNAIDRTAEAVVSHV